jgi:general L-amino acid transport system substrate-binding protein
MKTVFILHTRRALGMATLAAYVLTCSFIAGAHAESRLENIRAKGFLTCGIWPQVPGFAAPKAKGEGYEGLDVDTCRAVSAAIFGDPDKVKYEIAENVRQLRNSAIDIVARRITWSLTRATGNGLMFGPVTFYDGQGVMVPHASGITSVKQLANKAVCVASDEAHAATLTSYFHSVGLSVNAVASDTPAQAERAMKDGGCAAYSADITMLTSARAAMAGGAAAYDILPETMSKEPLAPLVRQGDDPFFEIVRWTIFAQIAAEERGITSQNVTGDFSRTDTETQRLLGIIPGNGKALGLDEKWAVNVIKGVGNYGEMFDRNVGKNSPLKMERGPNKLWTEGGLMYAPRLR